MDHYAGIDVSLECASICVVDASGRLVREAKVPSAPEALIVVWLAGQWAGADWAGRIPRGGHVRPPIRTRVATDGPHINAGRTMPDGKKAFRAGAHKSCTARRAEYGDDPLLKSAQILGDQGGGCL